MGIEQTGPQAGGDVCRCREHDCRPASFYRRSKVLGHKSRQEQIGSAFLGQWGIYVFPNSGTIIASDVNNGLMVMSLSDEPCRGMKCNK